MEKVIKLPKKIKPILTTPLGSARYRVLYGGRGSGKSFNASLVLATLGSVYNLRILCTREIQNSIKESSMAEIKNAIKSDEFLDSKYDIGRDYIRSKNGTEFIFKGLRHNIETIKSMAQIDICVVEEAESVPFDSWLNLLPTIRAVNSEIWIIFNPKIKDSWVAETFLNKEPPPRTLISKINYLDNPFFPKVLNELRLHDRETLDPALYNHIWEGSFYEKSQAQILAHKYKILEFEAKENTTFYYGLDFGFANDPTAGLRCFIENNDLYIDYESYHLRLELDFTALTIIEDLPLVEKYPIRSDSSRPESISYLKRHGLSKIEAVKKGIGSVEDGIEFIKSFKNIYIHPRCKETINEFNLYSYKVDRLSGDILPVIVDNYNHLIDALRYALEPIMKNRKKALLFSKRF